MGAPTAISIRALAKRFGEVRAVDGIDLEVRRGEIYGFLGRNGAGKTTTVRMILGLVRPDAGSIEVLGRDVEREPRAARADLGFLVETAAAYPNLTVRENLELERGLRSAPKAEVPRVIELLGLGEYADRPAGRLSLGNKQRLSLARTLIGSPPLLVLDEPANGLDPAGIAEIRTLLRRLADEEGRTVFMSSHILGEVSLLADRVGIIHRGRMVDEFQGRGGGAAPSTVRVEARDPVSASRVLARRFPDARVVTGEGGSLLVEGGGAEPAGIARSLVEGGVDLESLGRANEELEARFLRLTGGDE